jgi:hypothetical protein
LSSTVTSACCFSTCTTFSVLLSRSSGIAVVVTNADGAAGVAAAVADIGSVAGDMGSVAGEVVGEGGARAADAFLFFLFHAACDFLFFLFNDPSPSLSTKPSRFCFAPTAAPDARTDAMRCISSSLLPRTD